MGIEQDSEQDHRRSGRKRQSHANNDYVYDSAQTGTTTSAASASALGASSANKGNVDSCSEDSDSCDEVASSIKMNRKLTKAGISLVQSLMSDLHEENTCPIEEHPALLSETYWKAATIRFNKLAAGKPETKNLVYDAASFKKRVQNQARKSRDQVSMIVKAPLINHAIQRHRWRSSGGARRPM